MRRFIFLCSGAIIAVAFFVTVFPARALTIHELQKGIDQKNAEIQKLQEAKKKYQAVLQKNRQRSSTLKQEIANIDTSIQALSSSITLTERQIERARLQIRQLGIEISQKDASMHNIKGGLANVMNTFAQHEQEPLVYVLLKGDPLSQLFKNLNDAALLEKNMLASIGDLRQLRNERAAEKSQSEEKKAELQNLESNLATQKQGQVVAKNDRSDLLAITKNEEKKYQSLIKEQEQKEVQLEKEIADYERQIKVTLNASLLPTRGHGVLAYPLPNVVSASCGSNIIADENCITQYFGYTPFAASGAYSGKGHNGVDFRASVGTPVLAAGSGVVVATGDTDAQCPRASYGKWILVRHNNNLSTIYGHLSEIYISTGQTVNSGQRMALSGRTGYATGPHLHLTVALTQAVQVTSFPANTCGKRRDITLPVIGSDPVSGISGYLNPLNYL
ncbi:MAG: peptidoglycan DD-metalloendopeptidase family protein [Candidatus Sungbacteria bacterium]|nr:peptidoglycan DD-metalloendopeptidase family protein [Candidatus Sungbacteria bacterium]